MLINLGIYWRIMRYLMDHSKIAHLFWASPLTAVVLQSVCLIIDMTMLKGIRGASTVQHVTTKPAFWLSGTSSLSPRQG